MIEQYSKQARARIDAAVKWVEANRQRLNPLGRVDLKGPARMTPYAACATEDIEHGSFGDAKWAYASGWDSTWQVDVERTFRVYNLGPKVWQNSPLIVGPAAIGGADQGDGQQLVILRAWSATRLRGLASSQINPGTTGVLHTLTLIDGTFAPATASVYLPTAHVAIKTGKVAWAELRYRPEGSRWEAYSADCDGGA